MQMVSKECSKALEIVVSTPPQTVKWSAYHGESQATSSAKANCFSCGEQGHWFRECPYRNPNTDSSQPSATPEQEKHQLPVLRCHCSVAYMMNVVGRDSPNKGRRFYSRSCNCRDVMETQQGDRFKNFMWADEVSVSAPPCACGAGACTVNFQKHTQQDGTVTYNMYYTCRVRMGHGACGYLHFATPPKCHRVSLLSSRSKVHARQIEFWNQMSAAAGSSNGCKVLRMLGLQVNGWVGRLLFPPSRYLADPPRRHFFCCIYPLFDPILVENMDVSDSGSSRIIPHSSSNDKVDELSQTALRNDTQLIGVPLGTSSRKRSFTAVQEDVIGMVLNEVGMRLRKRLVFRSMESPDNDALSQAPNSAFDALVCLSSECGPFAECVMKIIQSVSAFVEMVSTVQDNCDVQASAEHDSVDECLRNISGLNSEALATLTASSSSLQLIRRKVSGFKNTLLHTEELLDNCETEILKLQTLILDLTEEVRQSKRNMQGAYEEVRKALKPEQGEGGQGLEKTALEEAEAKSKETAEG